MIKIKFLNYLKKIWHDFPTIKNLNNFQLSHFLKMSHIMRLVFKNRKIYTYTV